MVLSPEDALSTSQWAQARHTLTKSVAYAKISIANTMSILPFLDVRLHYQSQTMPRHCTAAFALLKVEWVIRAVKPVPNGKEALKLGSPLSIL